MGEIPQFQHSFTCTLLLSLCPLQPIHFFSLQPIKILLGFLLHTQGVKNTPSSPFGITLKKQKRYIYKAKTNEVLYFCSVSHLFIYKQFLSFRGPKISLSDRNMHRYQSSCVSTWSLCPGSPQTLLSILPSPLKSCSSLFLSSHFSPITPQNTWSYFSSTMSYPHH